MSKVSPSVKQNGPQQGSRRNVQPLDLQQVTVLPRSEWLRIQDSVNQVDEHNERQKEATRQKEALHLRSKEVVKNWTNTIAGQLKKKLEAKKIREEIEEKERKRTDIEEAKYQQQKRKEAIEKAKTQLYYQTERVKGLHSALLLTEVLKERELQIEQRRQKQKDSQDVENKILAMIARREEEALQLEQQKALEKKQERLAVAQSLKHQIEEHENAKELEKMEEKKEGEENQRLRELFLWEQSMLEQKKQEEKMNAMRAHQKHLAERDFIKAIEAQKQEQEEDRRILIADTKEKMMKLRKEKEKELFREKQRQMENFIEKLAAQRQEPEITEDELLSKVVAQTESKRIQQLREMNEKKAAMLKSIAEHREATIQEKERKDSEEKQKAAELLTAKKEADNIFLEKQQLKQQKRKEYAKTLQDTYVSQMDEKRELEKRMKKEQHEFEASKVERIKEEERQFQQYAKHVIQTAAETQRNTYPLHKAAREGIGGGLGPVFDGVRPSYLVQDKSGAQMPSYLRGSTQAVKELHETPDLQESKKRLGLIW